MNVSRTKIKGANVTTYKHNNFFSINADSLINNVREFVLKSFHIDNHRCNDRKQYPCIIKAKNWANNVKI